LNAMINPVITVCMGAVSGAALRRMKPTAEAAIEPTTQTHYLLRKSPKRRELWPPQRTVPAGGPRVERQTAKPGNADGRPWKR